MLINFIQRSLPKNLVRSLSQSRNKSSLARKTLLNMVLRISGVMLVSTAFSYFHVMSTLETQTKQQLNKYITERGQRESFIFQLSQDNVKFLAEQILEELKQPNQTNVNAEFDKIYFPWNDGTIRNFPQNRPIKEFDSSRFPNSFIGRRQTKIGTKDKQILLTAYKLISAYGPAWSNRFVDIYFVTSNNAGVNYWKGTPWGLEAKADTNVNKEEYYYAADEKHNPKRQPVWTGLYYDNAVNLWMVSALAPAYENNKLIGVAGQDIVLSELMNNTINENIPGTYNLIFQEDGRLIVHPKLMQEIKNEHGKLTISKLNDPILNRIFEVIKKADKETGVVENIADGDYLAFTKIKSTNWYFVTVYPKSLLSKFALETVQFMLLAGIIALLIETWLLSSVLKQQIAKPLNELITVADKVSVGNFDVNLETNRDDEIGKLAASFNTMAMQLNSSFTILEDAKIELENRVNERTNELQKTLRNLQHTQGRMLQTEKMSALGQTIAGIAHEINNPVNFVHGNITHVETYIQDLLELVKSYQEYYPETPEFLQQKIDEIDLEFAIEDLSKILVSMKTGTIRIREIVKSLRNFSRLDEAECKAVDIHEGIDNTLLILQHRLKQNQTHSEIQVTKKYSQIPLVECYAGQLNQVFMNILSNAIDALDEVRLSQTVANIHISTKVIDNNWAIICIADNGAGMSKEVSARLFDPFFTTKPVGKGTGLGLSISYQIIVETHKGNIFCDSRLEKGSKFIIKIPIYQLK
jgi:two-component system, NtrC family, sensor kinase